MSKEFYVCAKAKELTRYIFEVTEKSPKKYRFSLVSRLQTLSLGIVETIYQANELSIQEYSEKRLRLQQQVITDLKILAFVAELSYEQNCLLQRHYQTIVEEIATCRRMVYGWLVSDEKRQNLSVVWD